VVSHREEGSEAAPRRASGRTGVERDSERRRDGPRVVGSNEMRLAEQGQVVAEGNIEIAAEGEGVVDLGLAGNEDAETTVRRGEADPQARHDFSRPDVPPVEVP